jgi:hypothetical protein
MRIGLFITRIKNKITFKIFTYLNSYCTEHTWSNTLMDTCNRCFKFTPFIINNRFIIDHRFSIGLPGCRNVSEKIYHHIHYDGGIYKFMCEKCWRESTLKEKIYYYSRGFNSNQQVDIINIILKECGIDSKQYWRDRKINYLLK